MYVLVKTRRLLARHACPASPPTKQTSIPASHLAPGACAGILPPPGPGRDSLWPARPENPTPPSEPRRRRGNPGPVPAARGPTVGTQSSCYLSRRRPQTLSKVGFFCTLMKAGNVLPCSQPHVWLSGSLPARKQIAGVIDKILADRALNHAADHLRHWGLHGI